MPEHAAVPGDPQSPVSYTHLDVYKRQEEDTGNFVPLKEDFRLVHLVGRHEKEVAPAHDDRAAHDSGHGVGNGRTQPDVYKRQT